MKSETFAIGDQFAYELADVPSQVLDEFFGLWAIEESRFRQAVEKYQGINLVAHVEQNRGQMHHLHGQEGSVKAAGDSRRLFSMTDGGVAQIRISGPMMKYYSSMSSNASTVFARRQVRQASNDPDVAGIILVIDSPGGTVAGTMDLAQEVAKAAERKPVHAFIEDLTASAAFWVASQASKVFANNATALVGSIGTYAVLYDYSKQAEQLGVAVHVIRAGEFKGAGVPGTEVTQEQIENVQRIVNAANAEFLNGVANGRGLSMEEVQKIADGRVHPAAEAVEFGLVDAVQSYEKTVVGLSKPRTSKRRVLGMSENETVAATLQELKAAIPDADAEFLVAQMSASATVDQALKAFAAKVKSDNEKLQKQLADQEAKHKEELKKASATTEEAEGVEPLGSGKLTVDEDSYIGATGDPIADMDTEVRRRMQANPQLPRMRCVQAVAKANPGLHQAFLAATNPSRKAARMLVEKYEDN